MSKYIKQDISIGKNLRRLREDRKLSQEKVAANLDLMGCSVSREVLSQMERGVHGIKVSVLLALKELYHVDSFDEFFRDLP